MDTATRRMAVGAGWASVALALVQVVLPVRVGAATGAPTPPATVRALGIADLAAGVGLLRGRHPARWLVGRALLNIVQGVFCLRSPRGEVPRQRRTSYLVAFLALLASLDALVAWRGRAGA